MKEMTLTSLQKGLFTIWLNYPQKHNCIGFQMLEELKAAIIEAKDNTEVRALLIRGTGEKAFSSGANIKEFQSLTPKDVKRWIELGNEVYNSLENLKKPTVAYINGYAMGGGLELALSCDFRLASPTALISSPEISNGWLPGWGGMTRLRRLLGEAQAKEIVLLSQKIDAIHSFNIGLVTQVLDKMKEEVQLTSFLEQLIKIKPIAYSLAKSALMDASRTTSGSDLDFDILAVQISNSDNN